MKSPALAVLCTLLMVSATAEIKAEKVTYKEGDTTLEGVIAYDDAIQGKRPGVLVVHEWYGVNEHAINSAKKLAQLGYVGFALDMYGADKRTTDPQQAGKWSSEFKSNPELAQRRFKAALDVLKQHPMVVAEHIASIGFCFGGTISLEMARAGLDLDGVVSFHGGLKSVLPADQRNLKAKVLVLHGAEDPYVTQEEVAGFVQEMRDAKADWQLVQYAHAVHSFTNPAANMEGAKYNEPAARHSWEAMATFLGELFSK